MMASLRTELDDVRLRDALEWVLRLNAADADDSVTDGWLDWCQADPENLAAFEKAQSLWRTFDDVRLRDSLLAEQSVQTAPERGGVSLGGRRSIARITIAVALAASIIVGVGVAFWMVGGGHAGPLHAQTLRTPVASLERHTLSDGSRIDLGARSTVRVKFTASRRVVSVEDGEAFFEVAKDPSRPFVVEAASLQVMAVGTAFNIRKDEDRIIVTVSDGVVRVAPGESATLPSDFAPNQIRASAGVQVTYSTRQHTLFVARTQPELAAAWRSGRLEFVNEPLGSVIADLNRYSPRPITLDRQLAPLTFTGTVRSDAIEDWLTAIAKVFPIEVKDSDADRIVLSKRAAAQ